MDATVIEMPVPQASQTQSTKKGFTLTEIAIVLGIIGLILGAVWSAASGVYASANATKIGQQMGIYVSALRAYCANTSCASISATNMPTLSATLPTIAPVITTASTDASATLLIDFTAIPLTNSGTAFCNGLANSIGTFGGAVALNSAAAVALAEGVKPTCDNGTGKAYTCDSGSGYTATVLGAANCTGTTTVSPPAGAGCTVKSTGICSSTSTTLGLAIATAF